MRCSNELQPGFKRNPTIDVAKGFGILLVIFGHVCHLHPFWSIIYSFHMPLFFVIAGVNFHPEKYPGFLTFLKKKLRKMILPYLFFCLLGICYALVYRFLTRAPWEETASFLRKLPYAVIWMPYSHYSQLFNTPLWFVPCLVLLEVIFFFLSHIKNQSLFWLLVVLLTASGYLMEWSQCPIDFTFLPWNFSTACFATGFFAVGYRTLPFIKKQLFDSALTIKRLSVLLSIFVVCFLITGYVGAHNSGSMGSRELNNGFLFLLTGFTGTACVLIASRIVSGNRLLRFFGKNSFCIMGCQIPLYWATVTFLAYLNTHVTVKVPEYKERSLLDCVIMFLLITLLCSLFTIAYNKCIYLSNKHNRQMSSQ
jgi:fucose 4-O-acetylase-like acetyltransferase